MARQQWSGIVAAVIAQMIFGMTFIFIKYILNQGFSIYAMLFWRMTLASAAMAVLIACRAMKASYRGKRLLRLLPVVICQPCLYFIFESFGIKLTSAGESGVVMAMIPIMVLVLSRLLLKERHTRLQTVSILISVGGVVLITLAGERGEGMFSLLGYGSLLMAVLIAAVYYILVRALGTEFNSVEMTFAMNLTGIVFFGAIAISEAGRAGQLAALWRTPFEQPAIFGSLLFLAIVASVGAYVLLNYATQKIGPTRNSAFTGINSLMALLMGMLLLNERMTLAQILGGALIILGAYGANYFLPKSGGLPVTGTEMGIIPPPREASAGEQQTKEPS